MLLFAEETERAGQFSSEACLIEAGLGAVRLCVRAHRQEKSLSDEEVNFFDVERPVAEVMPVDNYECVAGEILDLRHLLINLAIGGSWGGQMGIGDALFPHRYLVDYVRIYRQR